MESALTEASWLDGFRLETYGGDEGALIGALVAKISDEVNERLLVDIVGESVGLHAKVEDVVQRFRLHEQAIVYVVLLWGMGGIGKTTLARAVYRHLQKDFEGTSFVENCGGETAIQIQNRLRIDLLPDRYDMNGDTERGRASLRDRLRRKKVLIVLDDVNNDFGRVEEVIDLTSLCTGSRVLVTSRDRGVFPHENDFSPLFQGEIYELQLMDRSDSWQLFCFHAFRRPDAERDFQVLASKVVEACDGHPLSLQVLGRHLGRTKNKKHWEEAIVKLKSNEYKDISGRLMISYDALDADEQQMFQDVACFLIGEYEWRAKYYWGGFVAACETGLDKLIQLSLLKLNEENRLTMHDLLRDLGRNLGRSSETRFWNDEDLQRVIRNEQVLGQIRGLDTSLRCLDASVLSKMRSLRLLFLRGTKVAGTCAASGLEIRWLKWSSFSPGKLPKKLSLESVTVLQIELEPLRTPVVSPLGIIGTENATRIGHQC